MTNHLENTLQQPQPQQTSNGNYTTLSSSSSNGRKRRGVTSVHETVMEMGLSSFPLNTSTPIGGGENNIPSSNMMIPSSTTNPTHPEEGKKRKNATFYQQLHKPQASGEFAPMSCQHCRSLHKKCDRSLPNCSRCIQTNHICLYPEMNSNNNNKKKKTNHHAEKASSSSSSQEKPNSLQKSPPPPLVVSSSSSQLGSPQQQPTFQTVSPSSTNFSTNNLLEAASASIQSPLSLSAISSKLATLDSTTQLKLFDMAANALSRNPGQLNSLIANVPPGLITAFTGKFQPAIPQK
ncbi:hypothetical protein C9374_002112 [Naegleria lovaniensis]|uniref:Zn(2)-C6 fungal-type domain-containing protein n=1 Tax=Naegleria lovaniensis TaxID=51637 RepID=A0AA88GU48_NAELO|nr:uncharacterized protein C9374_002112 [Naegleria lovaniensis]KAG2387077.1 hypothetical protein C9374_002112 [Naegleria lovaniensis]